jgi:hypothetical protein
MPTFEKPKLTKTINRLAQLISNYKIQVILVLIYVFFVFLGYIAGTTPNCCEDIYFVNPFSLGQKTSWIWGKTISEGRFISSSILVLLSGFLNIHVTSFLAIFFSIIASILIVSLWRCQKSCFALILLLLSLNSFLLMLYAFQFYFTVVNAANCASILSLYLYQKNKHFFLLIPLIMVLSLGTYQITLVFTLIVLFCSFFIDFFEEKKFDWKSKINFYGNSLAAIIIGFFLYKIILRILLSFQGKERITRIELWGGRELNSFGDYFSYSIECFKSFFQTGISSSLNPADSFWVGDLYTRLPLIKINEILIPTLLLILLFYAIQKRDLLKIILVIIFLPVTVGIILAPIVVSGSEIIPRTFYPFGLVLPTLILTTLNANLRCFKIKSLVISVSVVLLLINSLFHIEVFQGMRAKSDLAKVEHERMYEALSVSPNFSPSRKVLIYWYDANKPEDNTYIGSGFWPMYHSTSMDIIFKYELNKDVKFVYLNTFSKEQKEQVRRFILDKKLLPWNEQQLATLMPSSSEIPEGLLIIYYPHELLI